MWYKNMAGRFFGLVTKHAWQTDRQTDKQTDRQNYDSQDRTSTAASHGKKWLSACSVCILPPRSRRTACAKMRNNSSHVVWRHGQSPSRRTFHSAFYLPHTAVPHVTHTPPRVRINHAPAALASVWTCSGHSGRTGRILYTWPYWTPSKGPSNCPAYSGGWIFFGPGKSVFCCS